MLLKYRIIDHKKYYEIKEQIEHKLENGNYDDLENDYEKLNIILKDTYLNNYEYNSIKQLSLLVKSIILKINNQDYIGSLNTLIDAMKLTTPLFELDKYNEFVYSNIEIRILMNIALLINRLESTNKCIDILLFCLKSLSPDEIDFKLRVYYNLAYSYHRNDLHEKALFYANEGIRLCIENNTLCCPALLYSRKFIAEYFLGYDNYKTSLIIAMNIYNITGQCNLKEMLLNFCKKHNIKIEK